MKSMYKINYLFTLFICVCLFSCTSEESGSDNSSDNDSSNNSLKGAYTDTTKLRAFPLNEHELDITIYIPNDTYMDFEEGYKTYTPPTIIHNDGEARWDIKMPSDPKWHLVIEEISNEDASIEKEKSRQANSIFDHEYIEEGENYILYTESINEEKSTLENEDGAPSADYHFYCNRKINDYNLVFKSNEMGDFYKPTIKEMLTSALNSK